MATTIAKRGARASLIIRNARVFDPAAGIDMRADVTIEKGVIAAIAPVKNSGEVSDGAVDAAGALMLPGFVDLHTHLRTPGREDEEDIASGTAAAAAGGYVSICAMPNTIPVVDDAAIMASLIETAENEAVVRVSFLGAISRGQRGEHLADIWDMAAAGAIAFSDDGRPVTSAGMLRAAFQAASLTGLPLSLHCEDPSLSGTGVMNEGEVSARLGLTGIPGAAESADVARNLEIALYEDARVHVAHISCAQSLGHVKVARAAGGKVTCEVTPHHLALNDTAIVNAGLNANLKMNPPLRAEADRLALVEALAAGEIDCIATDHAPHAAQEKETPFEEAAFGTVGLETAFPVLYAELVETGLVPLENLVLAMSTRPAHAFGLPVPAIAEGEEANLTLIDTEEEFVIDTATFRSKSRNCAFAGRRVKGKVRLTIAAGREAYRI